MITVTKKNSQLVVEKMHKTSIIMNTLALNRVATLSGNLIFNNLVKEKTWKFEPKPENFND